MVMAKGIANGFPLSGIVSRKDLMDKQKPGSMGGTYAGNAVSCAAGIACAEIMQEERVLDNVAERSKEFFAMLDELKQDKDVGPTIAEVRGLGLVSQLFMVGRSRGATLESELKTYPSLHLDRHITKTVPTAIDNNNLSPLSCR